MGVLTGHAFAAPRRQRLEAPFGDFDDDRVHAWQFDYAAENEAEVAGITEADAYVMGRNMFAPGRGEWDLDWKGWWGEEPPYHAPVFVLTHFARDALPMRGGTTFHFVADGITSAMAQARAAAGSGNISIAGGATTINEHLTAGLVDELRLHVVPFTAGVSNGSRIFDSIPCVDFEIVSARHTPHVTHLTYRRA